MTPYRSVALALLGFHTLLIFTKESNPYGSCEVSDISGSLKLQTPPIPTLVHRLSYSTQLWHG